MIVEHDSVALVRALPEHGLTAGDVGCVVFVYDGGKAYEVEFMTSDGATIAVETLTADAVRALDARDMPHVRELAK